MTDAIPMTITVRYSCHQCAVVDAPVMVPARGEDEDVAHWVEQVLMYALGANHAHRSPYCRTTVLRDVKIPLPDGENVRVGDPRGN